MKNACLIIGEGPTEYFFLTSLRDEFRLLQNVSPNYPKNTSLSQLEQEIKKGIGNGFNHIYCMIDMDNKKEGEEKRKYLLLKGKYHNTRKFNAKKGIDCTIQFFETERCTELFFLYYFIFTTKGFCKSDDVVDELNKICGYCKNKEFFIKHPLHQYFVSKGGSIENAIKNANKSLVEKELRDYTYSELGQMFESLLSSTDHE